MNLACACQHRSVSGDTVGASSSSEKKRIEVDLEDLCVIVETAVNRAGLYMGRPLFPCWQRLPREVHDRLQERQREQMDRTLTFAMNARLHKEGNPHDTHLCSECVWEKAISRG
jgi:hypothetical protein